MAENDTDQQPFDPRRTQRRVWTPDAAQHPVPPAQPRQPAYSETTPMVQENAYDQPVNRPAGRYVNGGGHRAPLMWALIIVALAAVGVGVYFLLSRDSGVNSIDVGAESDAEEEASQVVIEEEYVDLDQYGDSVAIFDETYDEHPVAYPAEGAAETRRAEPVPAPEQIMIAEPEHTEVITAEEYGGSARGKQPVSSSSSATRGDEAYNISTVEQKPVFPGGEAAMYTYLSNNITYPSAAAEEGVQGRVVVSFIVEKDGSLSNVTVVRGRHQALDREALRVVKSMPRWTPGRNNGSPVRVSYTLPVTFRLQ